MEGSSLAGGWMSSMREADDRGCDCLSIEDATASCLPHFKDASIEMVRAQSASLDGLHRSQPWQQLFADR